MNVDTVIETIGRERFEDACAWAWQTAQSSAAPWREVSPAALQEWPGDLADVPHDIGHVIWWPTPDGRTDAAEVSACVDLVLEVYRLMPCYWLLAEMSGFVTRLEPPDLERLWQSFRELLEQPDDNLADPLAYTLAVEYFEMGWPEVWEALAQWPSHERRRMSRVLLVSASAPWTAKAKTFERLMADPEWHPAISQAIASAATGASIGCFDPQAAAALQHRLTSTA